MIYCIDIDGIICTQEKDYMMAKPFKRIIKKINKLYDEGHTIKIFTARGSTTGINWKVQTRKQLDVWRLKYHELIFCKPEADIYIDDKNGKL